MGQAASRSDKNCGLPFDVDMRLYALTKIHGVPKKEEYMNMYPMYTREMACKDIKAYRAGRGAVHAVTPFHKILKSQVGLFDEAQDPRMYVFHHVYKLSPAEIAEVRHEKFYSKTMALEEIKHQYDHQANPGLPPFRYPVSRGLRFANEKHGHVYKKGTAGYDAGYKFELHSKSNYKMPARTDPRVPKPTNYYYKKGYENAKRHFGSHSPAHPGVYSTHSSSMSPHAHKPPIFNFSTPSAPRMSPTPTPMPAFTFGMSSSPPKFTTARMPTPSPSAPRSSPTPPPPPPFVFGSHAERTSAPGIPNIRWSRGMAGMSSYAGSPSPRPRPSPSLSRSPPPARSNRNRTRSPTPAGRRTVRVRRSASRNTAVGKRKRD